jgi:hypothetical protein
VVRELGARATRLGVKSDLIDLFPPKRNLAEKLKRAVLLTSEAFQTYCEYAREKLLLLNRTRIKFTEAELVELIIADILDISVQMGAINSGVQTTSDLLILLSSYVKNIRKRKIETPEATPGFGSGFSKCKTGTRDKPDGNSSRLQFKRCFACGDYGHIQSTCTKRTSAESPKRPRVSNDGPSSSKTCEFCKKVGHNVSSCFAKERSERVNNNQRVNLCVGDARANDLTVIVIRGKLVNCLIDTGAFCSLLPERTALSIGCHVEPNVTFLKGIGNKIVATYGKTTVLVECETASFELDFFLVRDADLEYEAIIGKNVTQYPDILIITDTSGTRLERLRSQIQTVGVNVMAADWLMSAVAP